MEEARELARAHAPGVGRRRGSLRRAGASRRSGQALEGASPGARRLQAGFRPHVGRRPVRELPRGHHARLLRLRLRGHGGPPPPPPHPRVASAAPRGQGGPGANAWGEGADAVIRIPGKRDAAKWLVRELLTHEHIDMAYSYKPLHYEGLSHAFLNGVMYLDYERNGWPYPLVAMANNCYSSPAHVNRGGGV